MSNSLSKFILCSFVLICASLANASGNLNLVGPYKAMAPQETPDSSPLMLQRVFSRNDRFILFKSTTSAPLLEFGRTTSGLFLADTQSGTVRPITTLPSAPSTINDLPEDVSNDGGKVLLYTNRPNLSPNTPTEEYRLYLLDVPTQAFTLLSKSYLGDPFTCSPDETEAYFTTSNAQAIIFSTNAPNILPDLTATYGRVFHKDLSTGTWTRLHTNPARTLNRVYIGKCDTSGRYFPIAAQPAGNTRYGVYLYDLQSMSETLISTTPSGQNGNATSWRPTISADSSTISYVTRATNILSVNPDEIDHVMTFHRASGQTTYHDFPGTTWGALLALSCDGAYLVQSSQIFNLTQDDIRLYRKNLSTGAYSLMSIDYLGNYANLATNSSDWSRFQKTIGNYTMSFDLSSLGTERSYFRQIESNVDLTPFVAPLRRMAPVIPTPSSTSPMLSHHMVDDLGRIASAGSLDPALLEFPTTRSVMALYDAIGGSYGVPRYPQSGLPFTNSWPSAPAPGADLSGDGRFAFISSNSSEFSYLGAPSNGLGWNLLRWDFASGSYDLVSVSSAGVPVVNGTAGFRSCSVDGNIIYFVAPDDQLIPGGLSTGPGHFVKNMQTGELRRVGHTPSGAYPNSSSLNWSYQSRASSDGRFLLVYSDATNHGFVENNASPDAFLVDTMTNSWSVIPWSTNGGTWPNAVLPQDMSSDGRYVLFGIREPGFALGDNNGFRDSYVLDRQDNSVRRATLLDDGSEFSGHMYGLAVSDDGRFVTFYGQSPGMEPSNPNVNFFLRDIGEERTYNLALPAAGPGVTAGFQSDMMTPDGQYVLFYHPGGGFDPEFGQTTNGNYSLIRQRIYAMRLRGQVLFEDYLGSDRERTRLTVQLLTEDRSQVVEEVTSIAGGLESLDVILRSEPASRCIRVKASTFLSVVSGPIDLQLGANSGFVFVLRNGDCDGDNEVGPGDFGVLSAAFGSTSSDLNWVDTADLDGDGEVGPSDFGILSTNFGLAGE